MALLNVNPNRMELTRLKNQLATAKRGHKLPKDKQDALVKAFLERARSVRDTRQEVEQELMSCYRDFMTARAQTLPAMLESALMVCGAASSLTVSTKNVMSVEVPAYEVQTSGHTFNYGTATTPAALDLSLEAFKDVLPRLLQLAADEKAVALMSSEIEKTRRRVNALEHVLIPNTEETIRHISQKLEEQERATLSRLMKVKEIVRDDG